MSAARTVLIDPGGFNPWQHEELSAAIEHRVSGNRGRYRVIPVLLPGASRPAEGLPRFLLRTTWVKFSRTLDDAEAFHNLVCGIRGILPGMGRGEGIFEGVRPLGRVGDARPIRPIDPIETLAVGVPDPMMDRRGAHLELPSDLVVRAAVANGLDHGSAAGSFLICLLMARPFQEVTFPTRLRRECSGCGGTWAGRW